MRKGFTLIELLIVVAIIAILAAIAVPNFLEAQTRSKIARCKADMRTVATGLQAYRVDNNKLPPANSWNMGWGCLSMDYPPGNVYNYCTLLTTPVSYLTSIPPDPFDILHAYGYKNMSYWYINLKGQATDPGLVRYSGEMTMTECQAIMGSEPSIHFNGPGSPYRRTSFVMGSASPTRNFAALQALTRSATVTKAYCQDVEFPAAALGSGAIKTGANEYDPSNGTVSSGVIYYTE